jgi:hypothetical protein
VHLLKTTTEVDALNFMVHDLEITLDGVYFHSEPTTPSTGHRLWTGIGWAPEDYQLTPISTSSRGIYLVLETARFSDGGLRRRVLVQVRGDTQSTSEFTIDPNYSFLPPTCTLRINKTGWILEINGAKLADGSTRKSGSHQIKPQQDKTRFTYGIGVYNDRNAAEPAKFSLSNITVRQNPAR